MGQPLNADQEAMLHHAQQVENMALMLEGKLAFDPQAFQAPLLAAFGPAGAPFVAAYMAAITNHHANALDLAAELHAHAAAVRESALQYASADDLEAARIAADRDLADELGDRLDSAKSEADKFEPFKDDPGAMPAVPGYPGVSTAQFEHVYGRAPQSDSEWKMAQLMDTRTLVGRDNGVPARVVVGHIKPVPGQGLVRMGLYIPAADVKNLPFNDLGDMRGPNAQFDPRQTRVAIYVDYENGVVAARQNPSIDVHDSQTKVQDPSIGIEQTSDGRLRILYDATNPLAPLGTHALGFSVNGDVTLTPTPNGVQIDGKVGDYPSIEVYQDQQGATSTKYNYEATGLPTGPMDGLRGHHAVGAGSTGSIQQAQPQQWDGPGIPSHQTIVPAPGQYMDLEPEDSDTAPRIDPTKLNIPPTNHGEI